MTLLSTGLPTPAEISKLKATALRDLLKSLNLPTKGNKETLKDRLKKYVKTHLVTQHSSENWDGESVYTRTLGAAKTESKVGGKKKKKIKPPFKYYLAFDVEATCTSTAGFEYLNEIIEFPVILIESQSGSVISKFHRYVRPRVNPILTEFCTNLTGIKQEMVDTAKPFLEVLEEFETWLVEMGLAVLKENEDGDGVGAGESSSTGLEESRENETRNENEDVDQGLSEMIESRLKLIENSKYQNRFETGSKNQRNQGMAESSIKSNGNDDNEIVKEGWRSRVEEISTNRFCFVTDGPWDIRDFIRKQLAITQTPRPFYFESFTDLRKYWKRTIRRTSPSSSSPSGSSNFNSDNTVNLDTMLSYYNLSFEGRLHCGLDDTINLGRIITKLIQEEIALGPNWKYEGIIDPKQRKRMKNQKKRANGGESSRVDKDNGTTEETKEIELTSGWVGYQRWKSGDEVWKWMDVDVRGRIK